MYLTKNKLLIAWSMSLVLITLLIPPFQSPDEFNHFKRAYFLIKGGVFAQTNNGRSGGMVDSGLLEYQKIFENIPFNSNQKITYELWTSSKNITWSDKDVFSEFPNTAPYFPLIYSPQAIVIYFGKLLKLPIWITYYLTRLAVITCEIILLFFSFKLIKFNPILIFCLTTPMSLFQMASSSQDGIAFGLTLFAACIYYYCNKISNRTSFLYLLSWATSVTILATARLNLLFFNLLGLIVSKKNKKSLWLLCSLISFVFVLIWDITVSRTIKSVSFDPRPTTIEAINYYFNYPFKLIYALLNTFFNFKLNLDLWKMFIGKLGWEDAPADFFSYIVFFIFFIFIAKKTIHPIKTLITDKAITAVILVSIFSYLIIYILLALTWCTVPTNLIYGAQGRYLTPIMIWLSTFCFGKDLSEKENVKLKRFSIGMSIYSLLITFEILLIRYWI